MNLVVERTQNCDLNGADLGRYPLRLMSEFLDFSLETSTKRHLGIMA